MIWANGMKVSRLQTSLATRHAKWPIQLSLGVGRSQRGLIMSLLFVFNNRLFNVYDVHDASLNARLFLHATSRTTPHSQPFLDWCGTGLWFCALPHPFREKGCTTTIAFDPWSLDRLAFVNTLDNLERCITAESSCPLPSSTFVLLG